MNTNAIFTAGEDLQEGDMLFIGEGFKLYKRKKEKKKIVRDLHLGGYIRIVNLSHGLTLGERIDCTKNTKITIEYEE